MFFLDKKTFQVQPMELLSTDLLEQVILHCSPDGVEAFRIVNTTILKLFTPVFHKQLMQSLWPARYKSLCTRNVHDWDMEWRRSLCMNRILENHYHKNKHLELEEKVYTFIEDASWPILISTLLRTIADPDAHSTTLLGSKAWFLPNFLFDEQHPASDSFHITTSSIRTLLHTSFQDSVGHRVPNMESDAHEFIRTNTINNWLDLAEKCEKNWFHSGGYFDPSDAHWALRCFFIHFNNNTGYTQRQLHLIEACNRSKKDVLKLYVHLIEISINDVVYSWLEEESNPTFIEGHADPNRINPATKSLQYGASIEASDKWMDFLHQLHALEDDNKVPLGTHKLWVEKVTQ
jgi:hypothetical protein